MSKALSKNFQNIDRNKSGKFGVCEFYRCGDFWLQVREKELPLKYVNRVKHFTCRYHHETPPVDYLHQNNYFLYYKFSEMLCLNMQISYF